MIISVIGCGYLGAVHAACMAELGHDVIGIDTDPVRVDVLSQGHAPIYEPDLEKLLTTHTESGRLRFSTDIQQAKDARVHFIGVGTPQSETGAADLRYVRSAVESLRTIVRAGSVVVGKSTVPVGTAAEFEPQLQEKGAVLAWNPEFLREGYAVKDTLSPDRIVYGLSPDPQHSALGEQALDAIYRDLVETGIPRIVTDFATAELVKTAANAFLATKISFINAMADLCDATGADVTTLASAIGHDDRIGHKFLRAGIGFGGGCLPKDIRAFRQRANELGVGESLEFLGDIDAINNRRRQLVVDRAVELFDGVLTGRRITVLGAAFKPKSDDIRDSPALVIARELAREGAEIRITDPKALQNVRRTHEELEAVDDLEQAMTGAELLLLLTEWDEYRMLDPDAVGQVVDRRHIIDGRNVLPLSTWQAAGWNAKGLGRS